MAKLAAFLMVSLDGFHEGIEPWQLDWHHVDEEFNDFALRQLDESSKLVFGRRTYQGMASYWPSEEALTSDPEVAGRMNDMPKVVVSSTLANPEPAWNGTALIGRDAPGELADLKRHESKDVLVIGSAVLTSSLLAAAVLDELRLMVNPVILGQGNSVFSTARGPIEMQLLESRRFRSGNVLLTYDFSSIVGSKL